MNELISKLVKKSLTTLTLDGQKVVHILFFMRESFCGRFFAGRLWGTKMYGCEGRGMSSVSVVQNSEGPLLGGS